MLIDVQAIKDFLGITITDDDDKLMPLCQAAQAEAEGYCDKKLEGSTFVELLDGDGIDIIQLRNFPIKSITSIYDDLDRTFGSDTAVDLDDCAIDYDSGIVTRVGLNFSKGVRNIRVTYLGGYNGIGQTAYSALPYDLRQALVNLAVAMYLEGKAGVQVFENQEIVYRPSYMRKEAYKVFDRYRRVAV